ncbi:hypothetical protein [Mycetocola sp.]|uniref:hypothetical protein n=1 Tax=Mycetocola sp. TaxID=1871042 RepID=UPI003988FAA9
MSTDDLPAAVQPADDVVLTFLGTDAGFRDRLEASLMRRQIPAVLLEDVDRGGFRPVLVRMLGDEEGRPLRWATRAPGEHGLEPLEWTSLIVDLSTELDSVVAADAGIFGGAAGYPWDDDDDNDDDRDADTDLAAEIAAFDAAFALSSFTWYTPGNTDIVSVLARRAGEAFVVSPAGAGYVAEPTESPDAVFNAGTWAATGGLFLARSAGRRGAGFYSPRDPVVVHWWDETWIPVDPSRPWEMDGEGQHVRDYLDLLLPEAEPAPWTENFNPGDEHAEELRILLRAARSDESTFDRLVSAVGLPPLLAAVGSGRVHLRDVDGAETIEPSSLWRAMKNLARDEWQRPVNYPAWASFLATWPDHRRRRSAPYLAYMTVGFIALAAPIGADLTFGEQGGALWWNLAGLALLVIDVCRPRGRTDPQPAADDGNPSAEAPL